jgi:sterol desaturase/sphingolipid hydroxylase (fatty acid hydroxylase superfamily)
MLADTLQSLKLASHLLALSALVFMSLALAVKGREAIGLARRALGEIRLNLAWYFFDALLVGPLLAIAAGAIVHVVGSQSLALVGTDTWTAAGSLPTFVAVVFIGDFVSYWRHRLEHTRWLWPAHAIHHSDTQMTWLTLARFHPVNRAVTSSVDVTVLALVGFPLWALVANEFVRRYYGEFIHADVPWTYGGLGWLLVSPVMHQWHHARDVVAAGSNFATVFSVFDRVFGTHHVPGLCTVPLGVTEDIGGTLGRQLAWPFRAWLGDSHPKSQIPNPKSQVM